MPEEEWFIEAFDPLIAYVSEHFRFVLRVSGGRYTWECAKPSVPYTSGYTLVSGNPNEKLLCGGMIMQCERIPLWIACEYFENRALGRRRGECCVYILVTAEKTSDFALRIAKYSDKFLRRYDLETLDEI